MVDSYLFGGAQSIALVALEVIFWTYTDLYLEKFRVQLSGGAADWGFKASMKGETYSNLRHLRAIDTNLRF